MKIKIETTIKLDDYDVNAVKTYMADLGVEDETLREFIKSHCIAWIHGFIQETNSQYGE